MRKLLLANFALALSVSLLGGCPDNPYSADTWIEQLDDPKELERAVTELEHLCDPKAIPALGAAWEKNNKPTRVLQVIIDLSRSLTATDPTQKCPAEVAPGATGFCAVPENVNKTIPGEAEEKFCTDFVAKGRPANWDDAIPFLQKAIEDLDSNSQRSIDGAVKAAEALGDARADAVKKNDEVALKQLEDGGAVSILISAVNKKMSQKDAGQRVRLVAVAALGKYKDAAATSTLAAVIKADKDSQPPPLVGASINALGDMRSEQSLPILIEAMYRQPFFFQQTQRALIGTGSAVKAEMRKILAHTKGEGGKVQTEQAQVKELLADTSLKLMKWCGADGKLPMSECKDVAPLDYYAAMVVGGLYDDEAVDLLVKALDKPPTPAYYDNQGNPGPPPHNAILDALRKIGSPKSAEKVLSIFANTAKGKAADMNLRILAANVYGFVSADGKEKFGNQTGLQLLVSCASKNDEVEGLRLACAESLGRLVTNFDDAGPLRTLAAKYANASNEKRTEADGKPKAELDKLQKELDALQKTLKDADTELKKATLEKGDIGLVDPAITKRRGEAQAAVDFMKKCPEYDAKDKEATKKEAEDKKKGCGRYTDAKIKFDDLDSYAGFMKNFERGFENHLARVEIATRCAGKPECYMKAFDAKPDDVFKAVQAQNKEPVAVTVKDKKVQVTLFADPKEWGDGEKADLTQAQIERAVLDMRRLGPAASGQVTALLQKLNEKRFLEDRLVRQAIMLALPRIAKLPCDQCKVELEKLAKAGSGKAELNALNYETQLAISYFTWAGK